MVTGGISEGQIIVYYAALGTTLGHNYPVLYRKTAVGAQNCLRFNWSYKKV